MRGSIFLLAAALLTPFDATAQSASASFEVAAIKVNRSGPAAGDVFIPSAGRLRVQNSTLRYMIQVAYHLKPGMLSGASGWMESDRFDIEAKTPANATFEEELVMLQSLLADRFQLRFHRETRQISSMVLRIAKNGPKMRASQDQSQPEHVTITETGIAGTGIPFGHFVSILSSQLHSPIADQTGITGKFDLALKYARDDAPNAAAVPSVFAALEELGLKLEGRKEPLEVMVIDSAGKPRVD